MRELLTPRGVLLVWLPIAAVAVLHYGTDAHAHWVHDVARRLFYVPIVLAGILGGLPAGLVAAAVVVVLYVPHAFLLAHPGMDPGAPTEKLLELVFYLVLGGLAGLATDRQRALQADLRARDAELSRAARLQSLGELTAGLAHEIRNPLHAMRGTAEILLDAVPADAPEAEVGSRLVAEIDRLSAVLKRFLDFARGAQPRLEDVDLAEVATTVAELVRAQAGRQGTELRVDTTPATVRGDRDQLVQVGLGIAINGLQATEHGGWLRVATSADGALVVDNSGPPIPEELLQRVFDPFVSSREEGAGLGLAIAWRIIEQHGGHIEVANRSEGVRFTVVVPRR